MNTTYRNIALDYTEAFKNGLSQRKALATTIGLATLLLLTFYFARRSKTPDPPLEGVSGGMDIILGNDEVGMNERYELVAAGDRQGYSEPTPPSPSPPQPAPEYDTDENADGPPVMRQPDPQPRNPTPSQPTPTPPTRSTTPPTPAPPAPPTRQTNERAKLGKQTGTPGSGGTGGTNDSKGTGTTPGDQGAKDGNPNSPSFEKYGKGTQGYGFELDGRNLANVPNTTPVKPVQGTLTLEIQVDANGRVVSARKIRPSSVTDNDVINQYISETVSKVRFNSAPGGPATTIGKFTWVFKVN